jgi:hypothetical protein
VNPKISTSGAALDARVSSKRSTRGRESSGIRASAIVSGMALHANAGGTKRESVDLNVIVAQSVGLASHGTRPNGDSHIAIATEYDARIGRVDSSRRT